MSEPAEERAEVEATVEHVATFTEEIESADYGAFFERIATALEQIAYHLKQINGKLR